MEAKTEATQKEIILMDAIQVFMDTFMPATKAENDEMMTTAEICTYLEDIIGFEPEAVNVVQILKDNGYGFYWVGDGIKWVLAIRQ